MDSLWTRKGNRVKELIEERDRELIYLPPYSPEFKSIEQAFSKVKGLRTANACTREELIEAIGTALSAVTAQDASGFFGLRGYHLSAQPL
jgi:transposase